MPIGGTSTSPAPEQGAQTPAQGARIPAAEAHQTTPDVAPSAPSVGVSVQAERQAHTPGPWDADAMTGGSWCICTDEGAIADVWTTEADANLVKAAPDLLAALRAVTARLVTESNSAANFAGNFGHDARRYPEVKAARAAIAKAGVR
jgi:hypothetical protein